MKLEMTEKDIRLLKVMFSLLIAVLMYSCLVLPQLNRREALVEELENVTQQADDIQMQIDQIPALQATLKRSREEFATLKAPYYEVLESREVDEIVTNLVLKHELFPEELSIALPQIALPGPYLYSNIGDQIASQFVSSALGDGRGYMTTVLVDMTVVGDEANILAFVDEIEGGTSGIQLRKLQVSRDTYMNGELNLVDKVSAKCTLAVYMCSELNEGDSEE